MATADILTPPAPSLAPNPRRATRYTKGLSLNFPILPPTGHSAISSPRARADTCPNAMLASPTKTGNDILTLVAAQERRVLELREELDKAESELSSLKKKWAVYEASKKRDEVRHARSMAVPLGEITSPKPLTGEIDIEEERRRMRALVERSTNAVHRHSASARSSGQPGRKASLRVFEGGHTRTLSLLSHQSHKQTHSLPGASIDEASELKITTSPEEAATMPALDGFVSLAPRPQSFGKIYKDLAAQRKSLSPGSADALMKSGKQVVDGVRDGLWTFFEDIRQATIGEEAINGSSTTPQRRRSSKPKPRSSQENAIGARNRLKTEPSFWTEFGFESPVTMVDERHRSLPQEARHRNKDNKVSTSSQNVPDLLDDTSDEEWEQWDSPVNNNKYEDATAPERDADLNDPPWPELNKVKPRGFSNNIKTAKDRMADTNAFEVECDDCDGETLANGYQMLEELGSGSFGVVYKAIDKATGEIVAIKHVDLESSEEDLSDIISELAVLSSCTSSPYVTQYKRAFLRRQTLWIVMEYLGGGSCADLLKPPPHSLSEAHIAIIVKELLHGLAYLHSEGKLHRDIKAANVLLGMDGRVKLADFGVAAQLVGLKSVRNTFVGTPFWMAPEVIQQEGHDVKADVWSLGITAIELATGEPPHANVHPMKVLFLIPKQSPPRLEGLQWSREFKDFVALCLTKEPEHRPTAKELLKHKFVRLAGKVEGLQELIQRKQEYDASNGGDMNLKYYAETLRNFNHAAATAQADDDWVFDTVKAFSSRNVMSHGTRKKQRPNEVHVVDEEGDGEHAIPADAMEGLVREYPPTTDNSPKQPLGVNMSFGNSPSTVRQFRRVSPDASHNSKVNNPSEENQDPNPDYFQATAQLTPPKVKQVIVSNPFLSDAAESMPPPPSVSASKTPTTPTKTQLSTSSKASRPSAATTVNASKSDSSSKEAILGRRLYLKAIGMCCQEVLDTTADDTKRSAVSKLAEAWSDLEAVDPEGVYAVMTAVVGRMQQDVKLAALLPQTSPPQPSSSSSSSSAPPTAPSTLAKPTTGGGGATAAKLVLAQNNPHLKSHRRRQSAQVQSASSSSRPSPTATREPSRVWSLKAGDEGDADSKQQQQPGKTGQAADELKSWHAGKLEHTRQLSEVLFERWVDGVRGRWGGV
ncbi:hypothetical protein DV736_g5568, partial [Chaetothyriales sp. CBS 134916]